MANYQCCVAVQGGCLSLKAWLAIDIAMATEQTKTNGIIGYFSHGK
jgi:hypothetical protein